MWLDRESFRLTNPSYLAVEPMRTIGNTKISFHFEVFFCDLSMILQSCIQTVYYLIF